MLFLNQNSFIQREMISALSRVENAQLFVYMIRSHPRKEDITKLIDKIKESKCDILFTINEWGIDYNGILCNFLNESKRIIHVNWCVDDPFFEEIMLVKKYRPYPLRFDFVSDLGYVEEMKTRGYRAFFLPLAVDPAIFHPDPENPNQWENEIVFVGNSYFKLTDEFLKDCPSLIDIVSKFAKDMIENYLNNVEYDILSCLEKELKKYAIYEDISFEKALYIAKHTVGYFLRKRLVLKVAESFPTLKIYGDIGWLTEIPKERYGVAQYYKNLCDVYRKSKIVLDVNRVMVIRNGFTQRAFDVPASGSFLITSSKPVLYEFFNTSGSEQELTVFKNFNELTEKLKYYLANEEERLAIAERAKKKVLEKHTYDHRVREIFRVISEQLG
ncbi:MAG: glycosyltransferase [Chitinispirillaceae bacterium]|nr:glycosyltransferase [Chitinispirillaceae bacterium]